MEDAGTIVRKVADPDAIFLEEAKKAYLQETYECGIEKGDRIGWESYEDAVILPVKNKTIAQHLVGVMDKEGNYVAASRVDENLHGGYPCESFGIVERKVAYCGCDHRHWGHFLVNVVPRLWVALEIDGLIDEYVIVRGFGSGDLGLLANQIEFFRLLGILDKVRVIDTPTQYRNVIVPEVSYSHKMPTLEPDRCRGIYYKEFLDTYDYVVRKALSEIRALPEWKKVFFSRPKTEKEAGIEAVNSFFVNNGYHIIYAEQISLTELIYYLHHCDSVAYLSGTLQHNMLFASEGCEAIALERRLWLSDYQTDIDLMKRLSVTYINVQCSIMAGVRGVSSDLYAYAFGLQEYRRKFQMLPPDYEYTTVGFLQESIRRFLRNSIWGEETLEYMCIYCALYYFDALSEDVCHVAKYLPEIKGIDRLRQEDPAYWKRRLSDLLMCYNIPYILWDEKDQRILIRTLSSMIERNLEAGRREFLIFPYGVNGMLFEDVLRRRYGISPKAVFDNNLSKYNPEIKKLDEIEGYLGDGVCIVLTSLIPVCRKILEKYCDICAIESPFSIV